MTEEWIRVTCPNCEGEGQCPEADWFRHPNSFKYVTCPLCKGHRILLAKPVEVKPVDEGFVRLWNSTNI